MSASLVETIAGGMPTNDQVRALEAVMRLNCRSRCCRRSAWRTVASLPALC
jgi:hypothetical protein